MSRTNKKKARVNKQKAQATSTVSFINPRTKLSLQEAKDLNIIVPIENGSGNTYHWFYQ